MSFLKYFVWSQVVVLQEYSNKSNKPIEAKYVFPLDDMAAVCGFEAFINGKHIIGITTYCLKWVIHDFVMNCSLEIV